MSIDYFESSMAKRSHRCFRTPPKRMESLKRERSQLNHPDFPYNLHLMVHVMVSNARALACTPGTDVSELYWRQVQAFADAFEVPPVEEVPELIPPNPSRQLRGCSAQTGPRLVGEDVAPAGRIGEADGAGAGRDYVRPPCEGLHCNKNHRCSSTPSPTALPPSRYDAFSPRL